MESGGVTVMQVCITGSRADCGTSEGAWPQCLSVSVKWVWPQCLSVLVKWAWPLYLS